MNGKLVVEIQKFKSLFKRYKEQPYNEVFAHFRYDSKKGETWETPFERLASMAKIEEWSFSQTQFQSKYANQKFPILTNYLNYTFLRLLEQGKVKFVEEKACFNTGLQTQQEKDIYATFTINEKAEEYKAPPYTLYNFFDSYSDKLNDFHPLPELATYIDDPADLIFDIRLEIDINLEHIINENRNRLPPSLQDNDRLAQVAIKGAMDSLRSRITRNYKIAIPNWYNGKLQLLLPLHLTNDRVPDLALVVDKDRSANLYRARTVLTMDLAYIDARLITRPDRDWLNP